MSQSRIKILLVDDVPANLLALEQLIEAPDRQLVRANSGEEALETLLGEQDFAVILMDVQMPGLDGVETVRLLKAKEACQNIPIIFLTAFDKEGVLEIDAYSSGAVDYVVKPIQSQILTSKVDVFVELYRTRQTLMINNAKLEEANLNLTREISLRERAEAQLRLADQAIHDTHESVIITDHEGLIQRVNPAFCHISGFTADELIGRNIESFSSDNQTDHDLLLSALQSQGEWQGQLLCRHKHGEDYSTWAHISGIYNRQKILTHYCAILSEINDVQKTEITLRKVKLRLEQAQHISHLGGWEWNRSDSEIYVSDELAHILDCNAEQISPSIAFCKEFIHPDDSNKFKHIIESLKAGHATDTILRLLLPDGTERIVHEQTEVHTDNKGELLQLIGTVHDITERTKLEESFMQAQKMEAVGAMVGGIAHEFNNILAGMNGHMYIAKTNIKQPEKIAANLRQLETLSARAAETIQQMLTFSRKGAVNMKPIRLNALIKETLKLHQTSVPEDISLHHEICDECLSVTGDATLLQQLALNLIINARDALLNATEPVIQVCLQPFEANEYFLNKHPEAMPGAFAHLSVRDNGCGIGAEKLEQIFEPFFTSKGNQGTGLGLSMVYGAVQSHQGCIDVESKPDTGSVFHIYLPLLTSPQSTQPQAVKEGLIKGNGETVLIADDERAICDVTREALQSMSYEVITANNGQEAVDLFSINKDSIDLIILDVVMPKLGGIDAAEAIQKLKSDAKFIFMTGYSEEGLSNPQHISNNIFVQKPFDIVQLSHHVSKLLST